MRELTGNSSEHLHYNDWKKYAPLVKPNCKKHYFTRRKFLLIIVKTSPDRVSYRNAIRETYGALNELKDFRFQTVFVLGISNIIMEQNLLLKESSLYGDMLIGDFIDHYYNNTYKFINSINLAQSFCNLKKVVPYLLLLDDDYFISPKNLIAEINRHTPYERLYMGYRYISTPFRFYFNKFHISLKDYPFNAYPPYITAGAVLLTGQTVKEFYVAIQYTRLFVFDDVYAGILAYLVGIIPQNNYEFSVSSNILMNYIDVEKVWKTRIVSHGFLPDKIREMYKKLFNQIV